MAIPVARVHLAMAHASLPGLLPTPSVPLLLPASCTLILPAKSPSKSKPKPSLADADERWDARKKLASQASSASQGSSDGKKSVASCSSAGDRISPGSSKGRSRADAEERWDAHKKPAIPAAAAASSASSRTSSGEKWGMNTRGTSRAASAARWDAHKKPRPSQADDGESSTGSNDDDGMELDKPPYAGPGFVASPEPSMLPMPTMFLVRALA
ncbi:hypothetical protein ACP70R_020047 [Stipagrostis hirtigluma subsp. patula]